VFQEWTLGARKELFARSISHQTRHGFESQRATFIPIDWTDDGQRCQPQLSERLAFFQATRDWLEQHKQPLQIIQGDWDQRRVQAFEAVARLLAD